MGKKHSFPKALLSFERKTKSKKKVMSKELEIAKKYKIKYKPQRYRYKMRSKQIRVGLGVAEDYPYDWFLGGVDSCQGDSGGPLWRNIEVELCKM